MELIAVVLKAPTSAQRFEDAKALLNYGFGAYALVRVKPDTVLPAVQVRLGQQKTVQTVLGEGGTLLLEKERAAGLEQTVTLDAEEVEAPVEAGTVLGHLAVTAGGESVAEVPLVAGESVARLTWREMVLRLLALPFVEL